MPTKTVEQVRAGLMTGNAPIPLEGVAIDATITGFFAEVTVSQRYRNHESHPIEAVYVFPLDEGAAVCGFEAIVNGTRYVGVVKSREEAFKSYDDALTQGHGAYLLDEERQDVFTASVGNVAPGAEVLLKLTYVSELALEGDGVRFTVPTTVSPRYAPPSDRMGVGQPDAEILNPPALWTVPYGLTLNAVVKQSARITRIESPSHPISVAIDGISATVSLGQDQAALDRDFVLMIAAADIGTPHVWMERNDSGHHAIAVSFQPTFGAGRNPCDVVFLVDRSGSMRGSSIAHVRDALQLCLRSLEEGSRFDIVGFGSTFESLFGGCRPYDDESLAVASKHVASLDATLGGTEILPALSSVLDRPRTSERPLQVVILTDGEVTNTDALIELVRSKETQARVFTFGIGRGASHHLVRGLARAGKGAAEFIYPGERIENKVMRQFARLLAPSVTDVSVNWGNLQIVTAASNAPLVFADERVALYALVDQVVATEVTLAARTISGPLTWTLNVDPAEARTGKTIGTLAARARIRELEEGDEWIAGRGSRQLHRKADRVSSEIIRLGTEYALASRETSFVAIEHREQPQTAEAVLRRVPIAITSGWGGIDRMGETASPLLAAPAMARPGMMADIRAAFEQDDHSALPSPPRDIPRPAMSSGWVKKTVTRLRTQLDDRKGRKAAPTAAASPAPLARLVALQRADGSWMLNNAFAAAIGSPLEELERTLAATSHGIEARQVWATALAVAFFEEKVSSHRDEWKLLVEKARRWLDAASAPPREPRAWMELAIAFIRRSTPSALSMHL